MSLALIFLWNNWTVLYSLEFHMWQPMWQRSLILLRARRYSLSNEIGKWGNATFVATILNNASVMHSNSDPPTTTTMMIWWRWRRRRRRRQLHITYSGVKWQCSTFYRRVICAFYYETHFNQCDICALTKQCERYSVFGHTYTQCG